MHQSWGKVYLKIKGEQMEEGNLVEEGLLLEDRMRILRFDYDRLLHFINSFQGRIQNESDVKYSLARLKDYAKLGAEAKHLYVKIPTRQLQLIDAPMVYYTQGGAGSQEEKK